MEFKCLDENAAKGLEQNICPVCGKQAVINDIPFVDTIDGCSYAMTDYDCLACKAKFVLVDGRVDEFGKPLEVLGDSLVGHFLQIE